VRFVGLRKWILGFDPDEFHELKTAIIRISNIEKEIQEVKEHIKEVQKSLNDKASLEEELKEIKLKFGTLELYSEISETQKVPIDDFELEERIIELISKGYDSPTELIRMLGISADKLYKIINQLITTRRIKKIKKRRRVHYVPVEE